MKYKVGDLLENKSNNKMMLVLEVETLQTSRILPPRYKLYGLCENAEYLVDQKILDDSRIWEKVSK